MVTTLRVGERLAKAADRFLKPFGLTVAQFNFLAILVAAPDGMPQSRVGERLVVSRANVTGIVQRLKSRGLCRTVLDAADDRVKKVAITTAGARLIRKIEERYFAEIDRVARSLKDHEMRSASDVLNRLNGGV